MANHSEQRQACPECGGKMEPGAVVDFRRNSPKPSEWVEGQVESSVWTGAIKNERRLQIDAYRCQRCGYLKLYAERPAENSKYGLD